MPPSMSISDLNENLSPNRIFIIGGGIVGASLAYFLSNANANNHQIILIDKNLAKLSGSTGYAPGFVGQFNESAALTTLAKDTVSEYKKVPGGFNNVGGLELTSTTTGIENLHRRKEAAKSSNLPAEIITPEKAASLAPDFIDANSVKAGLFFSHDGTANAHQITSFYIHEAQASGVRFLEAEVNGYTTGSNQMTAINFMNGDTIHLNSGTGTSTDTVILATGIWTSPLVNDIIPFPVPIIPVAHPYTFTSSRPARTGTPYPFVRWLDHHVYARDHGDRDGLGSYNHAPLPTSPKETAMGEWPENFEKVLSEAVLNLKNKQDFLLKGRGPEPSDAGDLGEDSHARKQPFNGIFAVTPDNLPLAGKVSGLDNLWLCAAVWVTTAAGTAKLITRQILGGDGGSEDEGLLRALDPARFRNGDSWEGLVKRSLAKYNDIYNRESTS